MQVTSPVVLIVQDHDDSPAMYALGLLAMGFQPFTAKTGEEAFARACDIRPDVVVADVTLPGISGLDLTRRLRADARTSDTGIILLTGHLSPSVKREADAAGCDRFILKPCLPDALACEISDVLFKRRHEGADPRASSTMTATQRDALEGETRRCPRCRTVLMFKSRHPVLTVGSRLELMGSEISDRVRYERGWVCRNSGCDYREFVGGA